MVRAYAASMSTRTGRWTARAAIAAVLLAGCTADEVAVPVAAPTVDQPAPTQAPTVEPVQAPAPDPEPTAEPSPTETATEPPPPPEPSPEIAAVQQVLIDHGYLLGEPDGLAGGATHHAVMAFQKVHGLSRDGVIGPQTFAAIEAGPVEPVLRGGDPTRIEADLDRQVIHYVVDNVRVRTINASSGNGATYQNSRGYAKARTPVGTYRIQRHIRGERNAELGTLYDPKYFWRGFAIHGSNSVPGYEASHGCIRVSRADMLWLFDRMPIGMHLNIYGGRHVFSVPDHLRGDTQESNGTGQPEAEPPPAEPSPAPTDPQPTEPEPTAPEPTGTDEPTDPEPTETDEPSSTDEPSQEPSDESTGDPFEPGQPNDDPSGSDEPTDEPTGEPTG